MHETMMTYFQVDAKDEMREKSEDFFKFFGEFFKQLEQSLPKEEKKRKGAANTRTATQGKPMGGGQHDMNAHFAEM